MHLISGSNGFDLNNALTYDNIILQINEENNSYSFQSSREIGFFNLKNRFK